MPVSSLIIRNCKHQLNMDQRRVWLRVKPVEQRKAHELRKPLRVPPKSSKFHISPDMGRRSVEKYQYSELLPGSPRHRKVRQLSEKHSKLVVGNLFVDAPRHRFLTGMRFDRINAARRSKLAPARKPGYLSAALPVLLPVEI